MTRNIRKSPRVAPSLLCATVAALLAGPATAAAQGPFVSAQPEITRLRTESAALAPAWRVETVREKSAGTATLFSVLITGGGQFYNEETTKGLVMLTTSLGFAAMAIGGIDEYGCDPDESCAPWLLPVGLGGALAVKIWSIADAAVGARRFNDNRKIAGISVRPSVAVKPFGDNKSMKLGVVGTF